MLCGCVVFGAAPVITSFSPAGGPVGTVVTVRGSNFSGQTAFTIGGVPALVISNNGTKIVGMVMPGAGTGPITLITAAGSANSPISYNVKSTIVPNSQQGARLSASDLNGLSKQGSSVSIDAVGAYAIFGGPDDNSGQGAAWIYYFRNGNWIQRTGKLVGTGSIGTTVHQGCSVSMSADGNTAIVGGYGDNGGQGAAWVFIRKPDSTWAQQGAKLTGANGFGNSVSISADGNTAVVGDDYGEVWIFTRTAGIWTQEAIVGGTASYRNFQGSSVAISADAGTIIAGGTAGVTFFARANGQWTIQGSNYVDGLGASVAISADGNTAVAGSPGTSSASFFSRTGNVWTQYGSPVRPTETGVTMPNQAGWGVAISADGQTAAIGAPYGGYDGNYYNSQTGLVYIYQLINGVWTKYRNKLLGTEYVNFPAQGSSVALSANGNILFSGGPMNKANKGSVWAFYGDPAKRKDAQSIQLKGINGTSFYYGGKGNYMMYTVTSNLPVIFTSSNPNIVSMTDISGKDKPANNYYLKINGVGEVTITASQPGNNIYQAAVPQSYTITIGKASLQITADNKTGTANLPLPTLTASYNGFVYGDYPESLNLVPAITTTATSSSPAGKYPITVSGITSTTNYDIYYSPGVLDLKYNPVITSFSPATGTAGTIVTVNGLNLDNPSALTIGGKPAIILSGTQTKIVGMVMPGAVSGAVTVSTSGGIVNSVDLFTKFDNLQQINSQSGRLSAQNLIGNSGQGISVALSADGKRAIVGGYADDGNKGAAWIYRLDGSTWFVEGGKLLGNDAVGATINQGKAVALSADGNTAIVGGYNDNSGIGAAWVYTRQPDSTWVQQGPKLTGAGIVGAGGFGYGVALSADGNTAIIGAYHDDGSKGAALVFKRTGTSWAQQGAKLLGTGAVGNAAQGSAVTVSADGNTAMVSGFNDNGGVGAVWIYIRKGTGWQQQGNKLVGTGYTGTPHIGFGGALSADGNIAMLGGPADNGNQGAVWVFTRNGTTWSQAGSKITETGNTGAAGFGKSIALTADAKIAAIGGYQDNTNIGATWIYKRVNNVYTQMGGKINSADAQGAANQGISVAINATGSTLLVGGPGHKGSKGAAWAFIATPATINAFSPLSGPVGTLVTATGTNFQNITSFIIGGKPAVLVSNNGTRMVGMVMPGALTGAVSVASVDVINTAAATFTITPAALPATQKGTKFYSNNVAGHALQGSAVAISADGLTAVVGGKGDNNNLGAAWIYKLSGNNWIAQSGKLVGSGGLGSSQGTAVAISADGNTVIVTGCNDNGGKGAAWVYVRQPDSTWVQQGAKLVLTGSSGNALLGTSVALSADGNTALIGATGDSTGRGAAYVFARYNTVWSQQGPKLYGSGTGSLLGQGNGVALSADGNTAMVTCLNHGGYVCFYARSEATWTQQGNTLFNEMSLVGNSASLSADGNTAITGYSGAVAFFLRRGNTWYQSSNVPRYKPVGFGFSTAISADGTTLAIGDISDGTNNAGATYIYKLINSNWVMQSKLLGTGAVPVSGFYVQQGVSVALSASGSTMITGGQGDNSEIGAVWAFYDASLQPQTIGFAKPGQLTYGQPDIPLSAAATSGLPVTYTSSNPNIAVIENGKLRTFGRGTVTITATQKGNERFNAANPVSHTLTVSRSLTPNSLQDITEPIVDQALSPNGDGKNDVLTISNIEMYPDNKLVIINTNGDKVYEATGYDNKAKAFDGRSTIDSKQQKQGTYYYRLEYKDNGVVKSKTGYIVIKY